MTDPLTTGPIGSNQIAAAVAKYDAQSIGCNSARTIEVTVVSPQQTITPDPQFTRQHYVSEFSNPFDTAALGRRIGASAAAEYGEHEAQATTFQSPLDQSIPDLQRRVTSLESKLSNLLTAIPLIMIGVIGVAAIVAKFVR